ncbi:MAG: DNA-binding protein, partial [Opitutaceae bacterium]
DIDWRARADQLPWRSDPHLARCIEVFPGLRILRQPLAETLLCFLCSATKQIAQIRQMTDALATKFGEAIAPRIHILPTWTRLAGVSEIDLRRCQLGFRARFIAQTAQRLANAPGWLEETAALPYPEAKERLMELPGVGEKIADCALLFGAEKLEAFPVDVWLLRAMARHYGLENWPPTQIAHFGRVHFGPLAGLAQQYLFAWERRFGKRGAR